MKNIYDVINTLKTLRQFKSIFEYCELYIKHNLYFYMQLEYSDNNTDKLENDIEYLLSIENDIPKDFKKEYNYLIDYLKSLKVAIKMN